MYEPMFLVPYSLFLTYASIYMLDLGVSERQIGWITTLGLVLQIATSAISGYLTDRFGRKRALLLFDLISWSLATALWALAQNIWFFVAAAVFNSFQRVPNTAWYCLLVEDTEPRERPVIFTLLQFIGTACGLFAPLGGLLVAHLTTVPAVRLLYVIAFVCMTMMFIGRNAATYETEIGLRKRKEYQSMDGYSMLRDYGHVLKTVVANRPLLLVFALYILFQFQLTIKNTYQSIYLVRYLGFGDAFIAWFPAVTSAVTLALMFYMSPRLGEHRIRLYMSIGFALSALANILQIVSPPKATGLMIAATLLTAVGGMLTAPYLETAVANTVDDDKRAGMLSVLSVLTLVFVSPAGIVGGWSYSLDARLPFALVTLVFIGCLLLLPGYRTGGSPKPSSSKP